MYGGAGGGGKTWFLLKWLAEGASVPGYSGIFFRRTYAQLSKSNESPIAQSHEMYLPLGGAYNATNHKWTFPSGATIEFGNLPHEASVHNYQGPAYHRVAWDELTQFSEAQYLYLFSRMRRKVGFPISCGFRAASNPGGTGHFWVRKRFVTDEAMDMISQLGVHDPSPRGAVFWPTPNRAFVPSRVADNPSLDVDEYVTRLREHLPAVLAAQIACGDWRVSEGSLIAADLLRYYTLRGDHVHVLGPDGSVSTVLDWQQLKRFAVVDTAGTSRDKAAEDRGRPPSWSVCGVFDWHRPTQLLFARHIWRERVAYAGLLAGVRAALEAWHVPRVYVENAHFGPVLADALGSRAELIGPTLPGMRGAAAHGGAKLERATAGGLFTLLEANQLYLPDVASVPGAAKWMPDYEAELLAWTGREGETADQIDVTSYASWLVKANTATWTPVRVASSAPLGRVGLGRPVMR